MSKPLGPQVGLLSTIQHDGSRVAVHPSDVTGRYIRRRRWVFYALILIYLALPLAQINGHPAVHLDVAARRFYLFGETFNAQDFWLALFVLTTAGFALLFATAWLGRVWCGWACPQTVFLEGVYRRIERWIDGPRERRMKAANGPWTAARVARAVVKHGAYLAVSWLFAHVALALFLSLKDLAAMIVEGPIGHGVPFAWAVVVTGLLYFNFAWFREQLCVIVCPYGRLQSVLTDRHSLIVGYDVKRGEPRGRLIKNPGSSPSGRTRDEVLFRSGPPGPQVSQAAELRHAEPGVVPAAYGVRLELVDEAPKGDCVDCRKCITACPTGIDIRNGLQLECVACAQCVDACDEVMDKIGKPRGLIRFDSLSGLEGAPRRVLRPRLLAYGAIFAVSLTALAIGLLGRAPFEANVLRAQGLPFVVDGQMLRNQFELHLVNKHPETTTFEVRVAGEGRVEAMIPQREITLGSLESRRMPMFLTMDRARFQQSFPVRVEIVDRATGETKSVEARFLGPRG